MSRQYFGFSLLILAVLLTACGTSESFTPLPPGTGQLNSERSHVFFQKGAEQPEEVLVNDSRTASVGDEMWTQEHGRALVTFTDLWVRIYDDTSLHARDVTPSSIRMTMGQGAILLGEAPEPAQRVLIAVGNPARAQIALVGTLVMIASIPSEDIILVRSFDGLADVYAIMSEQQIQAGGEGPEWVLIGPDDQTYTPSREEVRALVRRAGFWDLYHEIEQDATNFGPPSAHVPSERVAMIFSETTAGVSESPSSPTRAQGSTPKPRPAQESTSTPRPAQGPTPTRLRAQPSVPTPLPTAEITCFQDRTSIARGECATLGWNTHNAQTVQLDRTEVAMNAEQTVCPIETHTYELRVLAGVDESFCYMTVEVRADEKPVISDIGTTAPFGSPLVGEPICDFTKLQVNALVTSPYRLTDVNIWLSDTGWSAMAPQGGDVYSSQPFKAGTDFLIQALDEYGNEAETDVMRTQCAMATAEPPRELEPGVDRPGMDISAFWLAEADPLRCRRACLENPECQAFTYTEPGVDGEFAHCWIKSGVPDAVPNPHCVSGTRGSAGILSPVPPEFEVNFDRPGMDYLDFDTGTKESCRDACVQRVRCRAFTFREEHMEGNPDTGVDYFTSHCWLKEGIPPMVPKQWNTSGAK